MPSRLTPAELVELLTVLNRLARERGVGVDRVEDLVQEVCLAALRRPPLMDRPVEAWFRAVMRRLGALRRRGERRTLEREHAAASSLVVEFREADDLARREALGRALADLEEPYRETLRLRFLEGLAPRDIAARFGVPVRTVHTRVHRGLLRLRDRLAGDFGEERRKAWFGGWWWPSLRGRRTLTGSLRAACLVAVLVPVAVFALWLHGTAPSGAPVASARSSEAPGAAPVPRIDMVRAEPPPDRAPVAVLTAPKDAAGQVVHGVVRDAHGNPVGGASIRWEAGAMVVLPGSGLGWDPADERDRPAADVGALSAADGTFALVVPDAEPGRLVARGSGCGPVVAAVVPRLDQAPVELRTAPLRVVRGEVVGSLGEPLAGVCVEFLPDDAALAGAAGPEGTWCAVSVQARTDDRGRFGLECAAGDGDVVLGLRAPGYAPERVRVPAGRQPERVVLLPDRARRITGTVVGPDDRPLDGAAIGCGRAWACSGTDGTFAIEGEGGDLDPRLVVAATGLRQVWVDARAEPLRARLDRPAPVLGGRVLEADGRGVPGALVYFADATPFARDPHHRFVEGFVLGAARPSLPAVTTDGDGRFRMACLPGRAYRVRALHPVRWTVIESVAGGARGDEVELRFAPELALGLEGQVVDERNLPVAGAQVRLWRMLLNAPFGAGERAVVHFAGPVHRTDAAGRFQVAGAAAGSVGLEVSCPGFLVRSVSAHEAARPGAIRLQRAAPMEVRVDPARMHATSFRLLDPGGAALVIERVVDAAAAVTHARRSFFGELEDGRSAVYRVPAAAARIQLWNGDAVVGELPVHLDPQRLNSILP